MFELLVKALGWNETGCAQPREIAARSMLHSQLMKLARTMGHSTELKSIADVFRTFLSDV